MNLTLKDRRMLKGLTQADLAKRSGLSQVAISLFENGVVNMIPTVAIKVSRVLECNPEELLSGQIREALKETNGIEDFRIEILIEAAKKVAHESPLASAAIMREALRLQKATKTKQPSELNRDFYGRKQKVKKVERDQFGRVDRSEPIKRDISGRVINKLRW